MSNFRYSGYRVSEIIGLTTGPTKQFYKGSGYLQLINPLLGSWIGMGL